MIPIHIIGKCEDSRWLYTGIGRPATIYKYDEVCWWQKKNSSEKAYYSSESVMCKEFHLLGVPTLYIQWRMQDKILELRWYFRAL